MLLDRAFQKSVVMGWDAQYWTIRWIRKEDVNVSIMCAPCRSNSIETSKPECICPYYRKHRPGFPLYFPSGDFWTLQSYLYGSISVFFSAGIVTLWVFHNILKYSLFSLLPDSHQQRVCCLLNHVRIGSGRQTLLILCSLFLGTCTHILWDSCTHYPYNDT